VVRNEIVKQPLSVRSKIVDDYSVFCLAVAGLWVSLFSSSQVNSWRLKLI
jgi:hypothetical protein